MGKGRSESGATSGSIDSVGVGVSDCVGCGACSLYVLNCSMLCLVRVNTWRISSGISRVSVFVSVGTSAVFVLVSASGSFLNLGNLIFGTGIVINGSLVRIISTLVAM